MFDDYGPRRQLPRIARQLSCAAFKRLSFDFCRKEQLLALAKGFDRFADRIERTDEKMIGAQ